MVKDLFQEFENLKKRLGSAINAINHDTSIIFSNFVEAYKLHDKNLSDRTKVALKILGEYGWYLPSLDSPVTWHMRLADEILNGNVKYVDKELCLEITKSFKQLSQNIIDYNPKRKDILLDAFEAHKKKKYSLSIPVFLSQSDGICKEKTNYELFKKYNDIPSTKKYVDQFNSDSFLAGLLEPFNLILPISQSSEQRKNNITFNRHQILHGEIINYNTYLNSNKAFSLLSYVCAVLKLS